MSEEKKKETLTDKEIETLVKMDWKEKDRWYKDR